MEPWVLTEKYFSAPREDDKTHQRVGKDGPLHVDDIVKLILRHLDPTSLKRLMRTTHATMHVGRLFLRDATWVCRTPHTIDATRRMFAGVSTFRLPLRISIERVVGKQPRTPTRFGTCRHLMATRNGKHLIINEILTEMDAPHPGLFASVTEAFDATDGCVLHCFDQPLLAGYSRTLAPDPDGGLGQIRPLLVNLPNGTLRWVPSKLAATFKHHRKGGGDVTALHGYNLTQAIAGHSFATLLRTNGLWNSDGGAHVHSSGPRRHAGPKGPLARKKVMRVSVALFTAMLGFCSALRLAPRLMTFMRQTFSFALVGQPQQQPRSDLMLIVDCGSGFTRAKLFHSKGDEVVVATAADRSGDKWRQRRLVDVLLEGGDVLREWVSGIQDLQSTSGASSVILGATGGLREAEIEGRVTPTHMSAFRIALKELAPGATFRCLSGEEEARAELRATQHVAELVLPPDAPRPLGMLSGGGATAQVAHYHASKGPSREPRFLSIVANLNAATTRMVQAADARASLDEFRAHLTDVVEATGLKGKLGGGTFVIIEMPGGLGSRHDYNGSFARLSERIGQRLLSKSEMAPALRDHIREWERQTPTTLPDTVSSRYIATLPAQLLGLLDLFDDSARLYVCREWPAHGPARSAGGSAGAAGGAGAGGGKSACGERESEPIRPDWSLGVYLDESA